MLIPTFNGQNGTSYFQDYEERERAPRAGKAVVSSGCVVVCCRCFGGRKPPRAGNPYLTWTRSGLSPRGSGLPGALGFFLEHVPFSGLASQHPWRKRTSPPPVTGMTLGNFWKRVRTEKLKIWLLTVVMPLPGWGSSAGRQAPTGGLSTS